MASSLLNWKKQNQEFNCVYGHSVHPPPPHPSFCWGVVSASDQISKTGGGGGGGGLTAPQFLE